MVTRHCFKPLGAVRLSVGAIFQVFSVYRGLKPNEYVPCSEDPEDVIFGVEGLALSH